MSDTDEDLLFPDARSNKLQIKSRTVAGPQGHEFVRSRRDNKRPFERSSNAEPPDNFGAAEISPAETPLQTSVLDVQPAEHGSTEEVSLAELIVRCENFGGSAGFFRRRENEIAEALNLGYALFRRIANDAQSIEHLREAALRYSRERKPPAKNVALLAMLFVCRAVTLDQRKICSDYASALVWAEQENVRAEDFAQAWSATTLTNCKKHVRDKRRAAKSERGDRQKEPYIEIRLGMRLSYVLVRLSICMSDYEALLRIKEGTATADFLPVLYLIRSIAVAAVERDTS